jgi:hypothetical protein
MCALSSQWFVLDAMRLFCGRTKFLATPRLVLREVSFKPTHLAVAFECKDVCCDAIEEPAVVANYDCATRELLESIFQCAQSVNI